MNKIHITRNHTGKMMGLSSINTSALDNEFCVGNENQICQKCYSKRLESFRPGMRDLFKNNGKLLSQSIIPTEQLPNTLSTTRFNSFGELINETHFINLVNIALKNSSVIFTLWTKRIDLANTLIKPDNMIFIYSTPFINTSDLIRPAGFDKVFSVYTKEYARENKIKINCKGPCLNCKICYTKNRVINIREILK